MGSHTFWWTIYLAANEASHWPRLKSAKCKASYIYILWNKEHQLDIINRVVALFLRGRHYIICLFDANARPIRVYRIHVLYAICWSYIYILKCDKYIYMAKQTELVRLIWFMPIYAPIKSYFMSKWSLTPNYNFNSIFFKYIPIIIIIRIHGVP